MLYAAVTKYKGKSFKKIYIHVRREFLILSQNSHLKKKFLWFQWINTYRNNNVDNFLEQLFV